LHIVKKIKAKSSITGKKNLTKNNTTKKIDPNPQRCGKN
jgi:hypothetical protein